jgi:hypothetical protein
VTIFSSELGCLFNALLTAIYVLLAQLLQLPVLTIDKLEVMEVVQGPVPTSVYANSIIDLTVISPTLFPLLSTIIVTGLSGSSLRTIFPLNLNLHDVLQRVAYGG